MKFYQYNPIYISVIAIFTLPIYTNLIDWSLTLSVYIQIIITIVGLLFIIHLIVSGFNSIKFNDNSITIKSSWKRKINYKTTDVKFEENRDSFIIRHNNKFIMIYKKRSWGLWIAGDDPIHQFRNKTNQYSNV